MTNHSSSSYRLEYRSDGYYWIFGDRETGPYDTASDAREDARDWVDFNAEGYLGDTYDTV